MATGQDRDHGHNSCHGTQLYCLFTLTVFMSQRKPILAAVALLVALCSTAHAATWPDHVTQAQTYVNQIAADNNNYGSPPYLYYDAANRLHVTAKCGSAVALLLKNTYPGVVTNSALIALTGSSSPYADEWFAAISHETADPNAGTGLAFHVRTTVASILPGDIIASAYTTSGDTGHVMVVGEITRLAANATPPYLIPGATSVNRYSVKVFDATKSIHGNFASATNPDSRYNKQWNGTTWVADQGIGSGYIALYENAATGMPVAWAWNTSPTTRSFYYAVMPPSGSTLEYRPLAIGYLTGL